MSGDDSHLSHLGRRVALGALIGAVLGVLVGIAIHVIVSTDDSLVWYELIGGLAGLTLGALLGGFYGGALSLPRSDPGPRPDEAKRTGPGGSVSQ